MDTLNYIVLIVGLAIIGLFWNLIGPKERQKETRIVTISMFVLGIVALVLQNILWPLA